MEAQDDEIYERTSEDTDEDVREYYEKLANNKRMRKELASMREQLAATLAKITEDRAWFETAKAQLAKVTAENALVETQIAKSIDENLQLLAVIGHETVEDLYAEFAKAS
jgi:hypothetical protein